MNELLLRYALVWWNDVEIGRTEIIQDTLDPRYDINSLANVSSLAVCSSIVAVSHDAEYWSLSESSDGTKRF